MATLTLPDAAQLAAVLKAARDNGVTRLKIGTFEAHLAPVGMVEAINRSAPLPSDPFDAILAARQTQVAINNPLGVDRQSPVQEMAQAVMQGAKLVAPADPTAVPQ